MIIKVYHDHNQQDLVIMQKRYWHMQKHAFWSKTVTASQSQEAKLNKAKSNLGNIGNKGMYVLAC